MSNPNDPAYPSQEYDPGNGSALDIHRGTTIRQEFVKAAMQGLCANPWIKTMPAEQAGDLACKFADATLAEEARTRQS